MNTKLTVALLVGCSVCLSINAYAWSGIESSDDVNWSYVMANETVEKTDSALTDKNQPLLKEREKKTETVISSTVRTKEEPLTLTYVDEAAPIPGNTKSPRAFKKCKGSCLKDEIPVQDLQPKSIAQQSVLENQIDTQYVQQPVKVQYPITRQYPISVQYPVTVQRDITIEQPVVMQQPVIVKRPVVMQQAITVQRQPAYVQQQPMIMQQQPTYIQQQPIVMQAPMTQPTLVTTPQQSVMPQPVYQGLVQPTVTQPVAQPIVQPVTQPMAVSVPAQPSYIPVQPAQPVYQPTSQQMGYGYPGY